MTAEATQDVLSDPTLQLARQACYRFAALSMLDPKAGSWRQLAAMRDDPLLLEAAALVRGVSDATPQRLGRGERPPVELAPERVLRRLPQSEDKLNEEFEKTFGLLVSNACPPYETEYIDGKFVFQRSNTLADVSGYYRAFGLTPSADHPERPDHVTLELEFMAFLIGLQRQAGTCDEPIDQQRQEVCRDAQVRFLREHLSWWTPAFARLLALESPEGFYGAAGQFLAALIPAERALLGVEPAGGRAEPSALERPEACEGCELAG